MVKSTPGFWISTIEPRHVLTQPASITFLITEGHDIYWAEQRPAEGGRTTILRQRGRQVSEVIPKTASIGSKIHGGYGGAPFCVNNGVIYFIGKSDQRIYQCDSPLSVTPITASGPRFCGLTVDAKRNRLLGVMERVESGREINTITAISILTGATTDLYSDSDFVGEPHISPDGTEVAFLTWNLPYMAWEESCIKVGGFAPNGSLSDIQSLPHRPGESHAQPIWSPGGKLFYSSDRSGYWNIYSRNSSDPLHEIAAESSLPLWSLGVSQYAFRNDYKLVVSYQVRGLSELWEIDLDSGAAVRIRCESTSISQLRPLNGEVAAVGAGATKPAHVMIVGRSGLSEVYAVPAAVKADLFSVPHEVTVPSQDGNIFGLYYPPTNPNFKVSQEPPVILMIHGGPTNCAVPELSMRKLYFTSRGFGVFDVNYRGSSGFGRKFRERLNGLWMVADVEDCIASATELKRQKLASDDLFIRGSSAGGATALLSLSKSKVFKGAGIYYPVTNLLDLNEHSPKFESGYVVGLVGPASNTQLYKQRSPISCVQDLAVAPVFFHGLEDRVCLPSSTIAYVDALKKYGLSAELHLYQNEGHSFRSGEVLSDALDKELRYYQGLL